MNRRAAWLAVALVAGAAGSASAQDAATRGRLRAWSDSIATIGDSVALAAVEARLIEAAKAAPTDPVLHLRLGIFSLHRGDLFRRNGDFGDALGEFEWAIELRPTWGWGWYGAALAEIGSAETTIGLVNVVEGIIGDTPFQRAAKKLARSVEVDTTFGDGIAAFTDLAVRQGIDGRLEIALDATRRITSAAALRNAMVRVARARIETELGDREVAGQMADLVLLADPTDVTALKVSAQSRFAAGRDDGADRWYRGLARADTATLALYREDLAAVMPDSTLRAFDGLAGEARVAFVRRFWAASGGDDLHTNAERLMEHYRRLGIARHNYKLKDVFPLVEGARRYFARYDDRGVILLHHGPPTARTSLSLIGIPPNESWRYRRSSEQDLLIHFVVKSDSLGYQLVPSVFDILALSTQARIGGLGDLLAPRAKSVETFGAGLIAQTAQELLVNREYIDPIYGRMLAMGREGADSLQRSEREVGARSIDVGLNTNSWFMSFELPLDARYDVLAVGSDSLGPQVQVAFAIPGEAVAPQFTARGAMYPVHVRASLTRPDGEVVAVIDTTRAFVTATSVPPGSFLLGRQSIRVPPGTYNVRMAIDVDGRGQVTPRETVTVPALTGTTVALSDLALGARSVRLPFRTATGDTAWVNPLREFKINEPMQLYFEVTGVAQGAPYRAELNVIKLPGNSLTEKRTQTGRSALKINFSETQSGPVERVHREVSLSRLTAGRYALELTITDPRGAKATRRREFLVVK